MELRHLRYLIAAAEHGSFRKAATALAVEQSALSRRIRDLETSLGISLFTRSSRGVDLTASGKVFVQRAKLGLSHLHEAAEMVTQSQTKTIRIGLRSSLGHGFLSELLRRFDDRHSDIAQTIAEETIDCRINALRNHSLDIAFLAGTVAADDCKTLRLWHERLYVACPRSHPLAEHPTISIADLHDSQLLLTERELGSEILAAIKDRTPHGISLNTTLCSTGRETLMGLVAIGRGFSVVTEANVPAVFPNVIYRPLDAPEPHLWFSAVWHEANRNRAIRYLLDIAKPMSLKAKMRGRVRPVWP